MAKVRRRKKSNKTLYILLGVIGILIIVVVVGKSAGFIGKKKEIEVTLSKAESTTIVEKVSASGTVQPVNEVRLAPDVSGEIIELNVEEGDSVVMGQLLAKIRLHDSPDLLRPFSGCGIGLLVAQRLAFRLQTSKLDKKKVILAQGVRELFGTHVE